MVTEHVMREFAVGATALTKRVCVSNNLGLVQHHGYFLPSEGASNVAYSLFSFESLAAYEQYRQQAAGDSECMELVKEASDRKFILSYERSFLRPVFE